MAISTDVMDNRSAYTSSFGESLRSLALGLTQLRDLAVKLAEQHEQAFRPSVDSTAVARKASCPLHPWADDMSSSDGVTPMTTLPRDTVNDKSPVYDSAMEPMLHHLSTFWHTTTIKAQQSTPAAQSALKKLQLPSAPKISVTHADDDDLSGGALLPSCQHTPAGTRDLSRAAWLTPNFSRQTTPDSNLRFTNTVRISENSESQNYQSSADSTLTDIRRTVHFSNGSSDEAQLPCESDLSDDSHDLEWFRRPVMMPPMKPFLGDAPLPHKKGLLRPQQSTSVAIVGNRIAGTSMCSRKSFESSSKRVSFKTDLVDGSASTTSSYSRMNHHLSDYVEKPAQPRPALRRMPTPGKEKSVTLRQTWKDIADSMDLQELAGMFHLNLRSTPETKYVFPMQSVKSHNFLEVATARDIPKNRNFTLQKSVGKQKKKRAVWHEHIGFECVLHPIGPVRICWCLLTILVIMYDLFYIPLQVYPLPRDAPFFSVVDFSISIFWSLDMLMNFRTGFVAGARVEMRPKEIVINYTKTWFPIDLTLVSLDWGGLIVGTILSSRKFDSFALAVRIVRIVRLFRLIKLQNLLKMIEDQMNSDFVQLVFVLLKMTSGLLVAIHFVACLWYGVGKLGADGWVEYASTPICGDWPAPERLVSDDFIDKMWVVFSWYLYSARWVLAQVNGRTDQDPRRNNIEMAFTCVVAVCGPLLCMSVFVSNITATMMELRSMAQVKRINRLLLQKYLNRNPVSYELCACMKQHVRHHSDLRREQETENRVLAMLPNQLQKALLFEIRAPTIIEHNFFHCIEQYFPRASRHLTMQGIEAIMVHQGETVFEKGDHCDTMLFAYRGKFAYSMGPMDHLIEELLEAAMQVPTADTRTNMVGRGYWVSEPALWLDWRNKGTLVAYNDGCFFALQVSSLTASMKNFHDVLAICVTYAQTFEDALKDGGAGALCDIPDRKSVV